MPLFNEFNYGQAVVRRAQKPRAKKIIHRPRIRNANGANYGGACLGCGGNLEWWLNYQLCDHCLHVTGIRMSERA